MANPRDIKRPLSPHLGIWRWGPGMTVSIIHRATGTGMATVGTLLFLWWLAAAAGGEQSYAAFTNVFTKSNGSLNILGWIFGVGLTWAFFQHMASGVRHLVLDVGANFELTRNKASANATFVVSVLATAAFWAWQIWGK